MKTKYLILLFICGIFVGNFAKAQNRGNLTTRILFIFDESRSMNGVWENEKKIETARRLMLELLDSIKEMNNVQIALRMYGHQFPVPPQVCSDTKLEVPFSDDNIEAIKKKLVETSPNGTTPIAKSLERCAGDFPPCANCRNVVILITDGIEACEGDPCAMALALKSKKIVLKPFVIGIGLDVEMIDAFQCVGQVMNAENKDQFQDILSTVIEQAINPTTCQIYLNDIHGNPTETNVNMTLYDKNTGEIKENLIHTMNIAGHPDTLYLDPATKYYIEVHTLPKVTIPIAKVYQGKHSLIQVDAPQGKLLVKEEVSNRLSHVQCVVRKYKDCRSLNVQQMGVPEKYIVGYYDVEVQTMPLKIYRKVKIRQSKTTTITIPQPGIITINFPTEGNSSLYVMEKGRMKWVYNINRKGSETFNLMPGKYVAVFRPASIKSSYATIVKEFEVKSGHSEYINMVKY